MLASLLKRLLAPRPRGATSAAAAAAAANSNGDASFDAGIRHQKEGRLDLAENAFRSFLQCHPDHLEALHLLGTLQREQSKHPEAISTFEKVVALAPRNAEAHFDLANAYAAGGNCPAALVRYRQVLELDPNMPGVHNNLGNAYTILGDLERAVDSYREALRLNPQSAKALNNLGYALRAMGRADEAIRCYEQALSLAPDYGDARFNLSLALLGMGDFARGWPGYECRFEPSSTTVVRRRFDHPTWQGEPLRGRTLLVWGEQGIGDEIQFASLVPDLIERGAHCVIECSPKLAALFGSSFPEADVVARSDPPHARTLAGIDSQAAMGSLGRWLRPSLDSFPDRAGFLVPAPERVEFWRQRLAALGTGKKVGFCWRSTNLSQERALYCAELSRWGPILAVAGVHFVCLQYDECQRELDDARASFGVSLHYFREVDMFNDLAETAALMQALDLVVSAPTAVSVLAAACGVPTWVLTYGVDWQTHGTDRQPWYPVMRRFVRQPDQDWSSVVQRVAIELDELARR